MSSPAGGGHGHGVGWVSWLLIVVVIGYVLALVWAYGTGLSPWVFVCGTLGAIGIGWFAYHVGHVVGHALHSPVANMICVAAGAGAAYAMIMPVVEHRSNLSGPELWCDLVLGSVGILFLAYEVGHMVHAHFWQTVIGLGAVVLVVWLWVARPEGAEFAIVPPMMEPASVPTYRSGSPGMARPSGGSGSGTVSKPPAKKSGGGKLDCAKLSPRAAQAAGCPAK
jgi:hypothetical protein